MFPIVTRSMALVVFIGLVTSCFSVFAQEATPKVVEFVSPLFTEGKEVVFKVSVEKLSSKRISLDQLGPALCRRFAAGEWTVEISGKKLDLKDVAEVTVRNLEVSKFTVALPDGREALISPKADRVARYLITGKDFEAYVRDALADPVVKDPRAVVVLKGIPVPGGQIPNYWDENHIHYSIGEPLHTFADVTIRRQAGE